MSTPEDNKSKNKRVCFGCGSDKTRNNERGYPSWSLNKGTGLVLCDYCYNKILLHEYRKKYESSEKRRQRDRNAIEYKDKKIRLPFNPRTGKCSKCGNTAMKTNIHHEEYDDSDVLAYTHELCLSCHTKESIRLGQLKRK